MTTIRKWLDGVNFDWSRGQVIVWDGSKDSLPTTDNNHPLLDLEFDDIGYGTYGSPTFIAYDGDMIYSVKEYDGTTSLASISSNPEVYLKGWMKTGY